MLKLCPLTGVLRRFARDEKGSIAIEAVIILPMMFWTFLALFASFHSYRTYAVNQKAAYTIADMISRQTNPIDDAYMVGAKQLLGYINNASSSDVSLRVTSVQYDGDSDTYLSDWSEAKGDVSPVSDSTVATWANRLPVMPDGERVIVVETFHDYDPPFNTGLVDRNVRNFVFTRPRYASRVCFDTCPPGT
jgi:Flp pilus assembly protein TadG